MSRTIDPTHVCLQVHQWPDADQALWRKVLSVDSFESEVLTHAEWRPGTVRSNREGYGRWINHLVKTGVDLEIGPVERVTPGRAKNYLRELIAQEIAPQTRANRLSQLLSVMLAFRPTGDWNWLRRMFNRQASLAKIARKPRPLTFLSGDVLVRASRRLRAATSACVAPNVATAIEYRNWLMLAFLTVAPLRRDNFANLILGVHLKFESGEWIIDLPSNLTKQKKSIRMPLPSDIKPYLRHYIDVVRPVLLDGAETHRFWISQLGTAMNSHSIYIAVTNFTRKQFGEAINPHRFRHVAATSTVIAAPELMEEARAHLTHSDSRVTEEHYLIAKSLAASRQHSELLAQLRSRLET